MQTDLMLIKSLQFCCVSSSEKKTEKFRPGRDSNPDLCDAGAVLHQSSYQRNWEFYSRATRTIAITRTTAKTRSPLKKSVKCSVDAYY